MSITDMFVIIVKLWHALILEIGSKSRDKKDFFFFNNTKIK